MWSLQERRPHDATAFVGIEPEDVHSARHEAAAIGIAPPIWARSPFPPSSSARHDSMDPAHLEWMAEQLPKGRFHLCPNGSHLSIYDDQRTYFDGLIGFIHDVDAGRF